MYHVTFLHLVLITQNFKVNCTYRSNKMLKIRLSDQLNSRVQLLMKYLARNHIKLSLSTRAGKIFKTQYQSYIPDALNRLSKHLYICFNFRSKTLNFVTLSFHFNRILVCFEHEAPDRDVLISVWPFFTSTHL